MARREAPAPEIANQTRRLLIMTAKRWDSAEVAAAQEAIERFLRRRRQDPQVAARRAAAAAFRQRLGVPECPVVYWTPDPEHPVTKVCTKCGREKHLMEFYLDYQRGRRRPDCKACVRGRRRRHYQANGPRCREQARQYKAAHSDRTREAQRAWRRRHPERLRHSWRRNRRRYPERCLVRRVSRGLRELGLLEVGDRCADCGGGPVELHHPDYGDPYRVVPLCRRCHLRRHYAEWRRNGGGPVKYPEEYRQPEGD